MTGHFYGINMTAGNIYTIVGTGHSGFSGDGGAAASAEIFRPADVAVTAGDIYTLVGSGVQGFSGDGDAATVAQLHLPLGVAFDSAGDAIVSDSGNLRIRLIVR
jgi:NHL repeat